MTKDTPVEIEQEILRWEKLWRMIKVLTLPLAIGGLIAVLLLQNVTLSHKLDTSAKVIAQQRVAIERQAAGSCAQGVFLSQIIHTSLSNPQLPTNSTLAVAAQKELATLDAVLQKNCPPNG